MTAVSVFGMVARTRERRQVSFLLALVASLLLFHSGCTGNPDERRRRIYELKRDRGARSVERIRGYLSDEDGDVRATALFALVELRAPDAAEISLRALEDSNSFVRKIAAKCLGDLVVQAAVPTLADHLLRDEDWRVRQTAGEALATIGGEDALEPLRQGLEDPVKEVRLAAVTGIRKVAPASALEVLATVLLQDPEWEIRVQAAGAIGLSGHAEASTVLEQALNDSNEFVRAAVAKALDDLGRAPVAEQRVYSEPPGDGRNADSGPFQ